MLQEGGRARARLHPEPLLREWAERPRAELRTLEGETPLLLVRLSGPDDELAQILAAASTALGQRIAVPRDSIAFHTVAAETLPVAAALAAKAAGRAALERRLAQAHYFVVPLKKRRGPDQPFAERLFVGRAHTTDVVLRHRSVSKTHAYFEADAEGWKLTDTGSKNGTVHNGEPLPARQPVLLTPGDELIFGSVETVFVSPEAVWDLLGA
jgi:hypothetical protein